MTAFIPPVSPSFVAPASGDAADGLGVSRTLSREEAFEALVELVRDWRNAGRVTTTAGLKAGLSELTSGAFSETALGLSDFKEFVQAAERAGQVKLEQLPNKHWIVLLPDESIANVPTTSRARFKRKPLPDIGDSDHGGVTEGVDPAWRLRGEVWQCLVDWSAGYRRLWDRDARRSFMYPLDDDGEAAWLSNPDRFVDMPVADMTTQFGWMREWASTVADLETREMLTASIGSDARPGQFRIQLERSGLTNAWRLELQQRVLSHAAAWARSQNVPLAEILDTRAKTATRAGAHGPAPASVSTRSSDGSSSQQAPAGSSRDKNDVAMLRAILHAVIDQMSLAELASIPVRAEYLLGQNR